MREHRIEDGEHLATCWCNTASQEEIGIQMADKMNAQAECEKLLAQRNGLLVAAKAALPYLRHKAEIFPTGEASELTKKLQQAITDCEKP